MVLLVVKAAILDMLRGGYLIMDNSRNGVEVKVVPLDPANGLLKLAGGDILRLGEA